MYCLLLCGLIGAGGVGSRGGLLVTRGHVCNGVFLGIGCLLSPTHDSKLFVLPFMALDGLGSSVRSVLDNLGSGVVLCNPKFVSKNNWYFNLSSIYFLYPLASLPKMVKQEMPASVKQSQLIVLVTRCWSSFVFQDQ